VVKIGVIAAECILVFGLEPMATGHRVDRTHSLFAPPHQPLAQIDAFGCSPPGPATPNNAPALRQGRRRGQLPRFRCRDDGWVITSLRRRPGDNLLAARWTAPIRFRAELSAAVEYYHSSWHQPPTFTRQRFLAPSPPSAPTASSGRRNSLPVRVNYRWGGPVIAKVLISVCAEAIE